MLRNCRQGKNRLQSVAALGSRVRAALRNAAGAARHSPCIRYLFNRNWRHSISHSVERSPSGALSFAPSVSPTSPSRVSTVQEHMQISIAGQVTTRDITAREGDQPLTAREPSSNSGTIVSPCQGSLIVIQQKAVCTNRTPSSPHLGPEGMTTSIRVSSWVLDRNSSMEQQSHVIIKQHLRQELEIQFAAAAGPGKDFLKKKIADLEPLLRCAKRVLIFPVTLLIFYGFEPANHTILKEEL